MVEVIALYAIRVGFLMDCYAPAETASIKKIISGANLIFYPQVKLSTDLSDIWRDRGDARPPLLCQIHVASYTLGITRPKKLFTQLFRPNGRIDCVIYVHLQLHRFDF